ncbi:MAG: histidine phosphatase family protein [Polyangia bacterium]|nr:histidine phosphatase family protein [Polyangia bacterium]
MSSPDMMLRKEALEQSLRVIASRGAGQRLVALLRHSARVDITGYTVEQAVLAPLTDAGRALARDFGRRLPTDRPVRIFHSEVPRCEDTAQRLAEGMMEAGGQVEILGSRTSLAAFFIRDPWAVALEFGQRGPRGFMREWLSGKLGPAVMDPPEQAARDQLAALMLERNCLPEPDAPGLDLHVSHDVNVMALLHLCVDISDQSVPWPGYLEGVILETGGGAPYTWWYHDRTGRLPQES